MADEQNCGNCKHWDRPDKGEDPYDKNLCRAYLAKHEAGLLQYGLCDKSVDVTKWTNQVPLGGILCGVQYGDDIRLTWCMTHKSVSCDSWEKGVRKQKVDITSLADKERKIINV